MVGIMPFTEWVQVVTQIITASTAVILAVLGYKTYLKPPEQASQKEPDDAFVDEAEDRLTSILVFKTSKQETWLTITDKGLNCRIDDTRVGRGGSQWTLEKSQATQILNSNLFHVNSGYKVKTGTFTLGPKRNWLYSKVLFPEADYLHSVLKQLLANVSS